MKKMKIKTLDNIVKGLVVITLAGALATVGLSLKESTKKYAPAFAGATVVSSLALAGATLYDIKRTSANRDYQNN